MAERSSRVHAIIGADSYLAEEALESLLGRAIGADRENGLQVLRGDEATWAQVVDAARSRSLFAARRAVVVRNAEALKGEGEGVEEYIEDPNPDVTLILIAARPDKRRAVWKKVLAAALVTPAEPLKGRALRSFVSERVRRSKLSLTDDGLEELLERVGQDLRRLMGEIEKLSAFSRGAKALSGEDVAAVLGRGLPRPLYRLGDAMMERQPRVVLALLGDMLEEGEPPLKLLSSLHWALRRVRGARALREAGVPRDQIASRLGIVPFKVADVLEASRRWSDAELTSAMVALGWADRNLKTGADARWVLASAVREACGPSGRVARPLLGSAR